MQLNLMIILNLFLASGLLAGDEVLAVNGSAVSGLDLDHLQTLFRHQNLRLLLRRDELPDVEEPTITWPDPADLWVKQSDLHTWTSGNAAAASELWQRLTVTFTGKKISH